MQVYGVIGVFGAARYGAATEGNILVNSWLGGSAEGILDLAIAAYLSISVPPVQARSHHAMTTLFRVTSLVTHWTSHRCPTGSCVAP